MNVLPKALFICFKGILWREYLRFIQQKGRFIAALVRPLVWLFIFAAGFRSILGVSIIPPYETYVLYEEYITPGLIAMVQLFSGMQNSLSMVYDREMGSMRILLASPMPRWFLLSSRLLSSAVISLFQVYLFLLIAWLWGVRPPALGYVLILPVLLLSGLMLGAIGLFLSSVVRQLENFSGVMNFVIFPMFFTSSALYPLWRLKESSVVLHNIAYFNPFSHAVELIRFALYGELNLIALSWVIAITIFFLALSFWSYNPSKKTFLRIK